MNRDTNCDRVRQQWMATLDGEANREAAEHAEHMSTCPACREWRRAFESMDTQLQALSYPVTKTDLWAAVHDGIQAREAGWSLTHRLLVIAALVFAWRALQLLVDLPLPLLHPIVPMTAVVAALWQIAGDPLAIETFAPELQKRGV